MIILKHLTIERFRLLRSLNLHFPQRGSILIQGPNESGKSALIESISFALYGEALAARRGSRSLDDLILYGAANATVSLALSVGATELTITRTIERGLGQQVSLLVQQLGSAEEAPITDLAMVNARIIAELGAMDGETLRNSEFIEQKGLTRLETLSGRVREAVVRKLLGLETITELASRFQVHPQDDEALRVSAERLRLAEIQERIPQVGTQLDQIATALDAVAVNEYLADVDQQNNEIAELEQSIEAIHARRLELKSHQSRVQQLKRADSTLSDIIASYDDIAEARRELPRLEQEIVDLERREREELPRIEKRVNELAELTLSYGTLQRVSNDLLTTVDTIKALEQEVRDQSATQQEVRSLEVQVKQARERLENVRLQWQELEEHRRSARPQLEARLQRLQFLAQRLNELKLLEDRYVQRLASRSQAEENTEQLRKVMHDLESSEDELELVEGEARAVQQQAEELEQNWRQFNLRRHVEEWLRLKGLSQGLAQAEINVNQARQRAGELTQVWTQARSTATRLVISMSLCAVLGLLLFFTAIFIFASNSVLSTIVLLLVVVDSIAASFLYKSYRTARAREHNLKAEEQEAISQAGMMVVAREAAQRMAGNVETLAQVEQEILSLGSSVPRSLEEAQQFLDRTKNQFDAGDMQLRLQMKRDEAKADLNRVNASREAIAALQKERERLEHLRKKEQWNTIEKNLSDDQQNISLLHQELTMLAGQEGLPLPSINARVQASPIPSEQSFASGPLASVDVEEDANGIPDLSELVKSTIRATEQEIVSLDGKLDMVSDLANQTREHQATLDQLLERQRSLQDRYNHYQSSNPAQQLESAREQQMALLARNSLSLILYASALRISALPIVSLLPIMPRLLRVNSSKSYTLRWVTSLCFRSAWSTSPRF